MSELSRDNGPLPHNVAARMIPTIRRIAYRLARRLPSHISVDDLTSAGFIGLATAYGRFDASLGDDFSAYAEFRIRGAMLDELRADDQLTRDLRAHANRIAGATRALEHRLGRAPRESEIAAELGCDEEAFRASANRATVTALVSLDAPANDDGPIQVVDPDAKGADERLFEAESRRAARAAFEALPPRLRRVIELYYGDELTLREIGMQLGVTESRVSQIVGEAVVRMRAHCGGMDLASASRAAARSAGTTPRRARTAAPAIAA